ncbi:MAG: FGGY family carbohydrate kinase [Ferruginibacter sp.]
MLLLGIDIGTSSIKISVIDAASQKKIASAQYPETESAISSLQPGWAEQSPMMWWEHTVKAIQQANAEKKYDPADIAAIGIAYQMHGLVLVDKDKNVLRDAIIWCDSRAVEIGNAAFQNIGKEKCLATLLNSPGNFTASKLAWVKEHEPLVYDQINKAMLPGDFIAMKLTGSITTSAAALSEAVLWDFQTNGLSQDVLEYFGFEEKFFPGIQPVFSVHGTLDPAVAATLALRPGVPVTYKAGDQPNNALSLNVLEPGEVAATAGTSGVIYAVGDTLGYDTQSRVNGFAHVNHTKEKIRIGTLLCINGTGIANSWTKKIMSEGKDYNAINKDASSISIGSEGLQVLPFGNGAERIFSNETVGAHYHNIDFNLHTTAHIFRAVQEGIAFAFRYGLDIMKENGMHPRVIRAGRANLFLSDVFCEAFVNTLNVPLELYECDGSVGAALGAGIGADLIDLNNKNAIINKALKIIQPEMHKVVQYDDGYVAWKKLLTKFI